MNELKQKLATAIKLELSQRIAYGTEQCISFRDTSIGFSVVLLRSIGVSTDKRSGVNVYVNRKYNVLIFEFVKDPKQGALTLQPRMGISCSAIYKLLKNNGYSAPRGHFTPTSISQDLEAGRSYVEFSLLGSVEYVR